MLAWQVLYVNKIIVSYHSQLYALSLDYVDSLMPAMFALCIFLIYLL